MRRELTVFARLMLTSSIIVVLMIGLGIFSVGAMKSLDARVADLRSDWLPGMRYSLMMQSELRRFRSNELEFVMASDNDDRAKYQKELSQTLLAYHDAEKNYAQHASASNDKEHDAYTDLKKRFQAYMTADAAIVDLARQLKTDEAQSLLNGESQTEMDAINIDVSRIVELNASGADQAGMRANASFTRSTWIEITLIAGAALASLALAWYTARDLVRQLGGEPRYAMEVAEQIAQGDLSTEVRLRTGDSSSLLSALARMKDGLRTIIAEIQQTSHEISGATGEIAQGNAQLSQRTEEQAADLEQAAASIEQLSATVKHTAENARHLRDRAQGTVDLVGNTGQAMQKVVGNMLDISANSKKISDIVGAIEALSFQTNILSLNAAVESARAGQHGRGFAVVASEVRTLAQRSASAAREIKDLIQNSTRTVDTGVELVTQVGETMEKVVGEVQRVALIISDITSATADQSDGVEQINITIAHIDEMTQRNASLVENTRAASSALDIQGQRLEDVTTVFVMPTTQRTEQTQAATTHYGQ